MHYHLLKLWVDENKNRKYIIKEIKKFQDQISIFFKNSKTFLQINFNPQNSFCFYSQKTELPFKQHLSNLSSILKDFRIVDTQIMKNDRIIKFYLTQTDIFNRENKLFLFVELIPFFPNLIITDENLIIKESIKKISPSENMKRPVLPSLTYQLTHFELNSNLTFPVKIDKNYYLEKIPENINLFFENFYYETILKNLLEKQKNLIIKRLKKEIDKKTKKLKKLYVELETSEKEDTWKMYLELLKSSYDKIKKGMDKIEVINYYDEKMPVITIPLNPRFSASQNLNYYAKKYKKAVSGKEQIKKQIEKTKREIETLQSQINKAHADIQTLENTYKKEKQPVKKLKSIRINDDWEIIIGRSNLENDLITLKIAKPWDWWFHTRIFHGTHVVLKNYKKLQLPEHLIKICAGLAAYHSKAKKSSNVPVDYTQIRFVRKPKGSAPGFVTYSHQKTLYVDPIDERKALEILKL